MFRKTTKVVTAIIAVIWLLLYLLSNTVYQHDELYNHYGNDFTNFGYSRYNSQGVEDAWNFFKKINGHMNYVENIRCCYVDEDTAYLVSNDKKYVVLDIVSGECILYEGSENITDEEHLRTFQFISRMHILRGLLLGKCKSRALI